MADKICPLFSIAANWTSLGRPQLISFLQREVKQNENSTNLSFTTDRTD